MKSWILSIRADNKDIFLEIKRGEKTVETRAASGKYRTVQKGDTLIFVCGSSRLRKKVKRVRIFKNLGAMAKVIPMKKIMPSAPTLTKARKIYYGYPGYKEKIARHGIIAFDI